MEDVLLLIVVTYGVSLGFGFLLQKYLKIPWMFAALFFGIVLSVFGFFTPSIESESFQLLATLGMLVILFMIGFNLDLKEIKKLGKQIFIGTIFIISLEGFWGSLLFYFGFPAHVSNSYLVALITALSFATVGEAILLPILSEFKVLNTTFGQLTLGIGTFDDIIEVLMLAIIAALPAFLPKAQVQSVPDPLLILSALGGLLLLALAMTKLGSKLKTTLRKNSNMSYVHLLLLLFVFFSFAALGGLVFEDLATVGALLGGIVARQLLPEEMLNEDEKAINFLGYVFLSPFFFLSIGANVSLTSLFISPLLIVLILVVANSSKYLTSFLLFRKMLGTKYSLLLGVGLGVRFSTSLVVQFILFSSGYISLALYSALIATAIIMKPIIIGIYSWGLSSGKPP
ncbi:MAG: cation:proton antiporter [Candidatus Bathyarchaeia archaeon]